METKEDVKEDNNISIQEIKEYVPIFSVVLFANSFMYLYFYYSVFNVKITSYITISEITFNFLNQFMWFLVIAAFFFLTYLILKKKQKNNLQNTMLSFFILLIFLISIILNYFIIKNNPFFNYFLNTITVITFSMALRTRADDAKTIYYVFCIFLGSLFIIGFNSSEYARSIQKDTIVKNVSFKYDDLIYKTSNKLVYIGETQNYIFLYNRIDSSTLIFKSSNIDSLVISNKKLYW